MFESMKDFDARAFLQKHKPRNLFKKKPPVDDPDDYTPLLDGGNPIEGVVETEESWASIIFGWVQGLLSLVLMAALFMSVLYALLATFIILWVPIGSEAAIDDRSVVVRGSWSETAGVPPVGDNAVISLSTTTSETKVYEYTLYGFTGIPHSAEVKVLSSDRDAVSVTKNKKQPNAEYQTGTATLKPYNDSRKVQKFSNFTGSAAFDFDPESADTPSIQTVELVGEKLLVECVAGDCIPGTTFIIFNDQVFGKIFAGSPVEAIKADQGE